MFLVWIEPLFAIWWSRRESVKDFMSNKKLNCGHKIHIFSRLLHSHPSHRTPLYWDVYRHKNNLTINRKGLRNCVEFQFILVWVWEGRKFAHLNNFNISQKIIHSIKINWIYRQLLGFLATLTDHVIFYFKYKRLKIWLKYLETIPKNSLQINCKIWQ